jgi:RND family efflux transporter MFP subunit
VKVASPKKQPVRWVVEQPASVMPYEVTPLVAKLPGYVKTIAPDESAVANGKKDAEIDLGSEVKKHQLLAALHIPEVEAKLAERQAAAAQAEAELDAARADLKVFDALVGEAKAKVTEAQAGVERAKADVDRWTTQLAYEEGLLKKGNFDPQSRDVTVKQLAAAKASVAETEARVVSAKATVEERQARRKRADADVRAAAARLEVAKAQVRMAEVDVSYLQVKAPFDGIVTTRNVHPGHFVQPGVVLFTVAQVGRVRVAVDLPEAAADKAGPGTPASVRVPALNNREYSDQVTVTRTAGVVLPDTRTLRAEIELNNPDRALKPGMYAHVTIQGVTAEATVLPAGCVLAADETHYVYLVENGKAVKYRVRVGRTEGGNEQVLDRRRATATVGDWVPFTGAEKVVVGNLGALTDGAAVEVKE